MKKLIVLTAATLLSLNLFASETVKGMQKDYETFKTKMSAKIQTIEKDIAALKEKAAKEGSSVKDTTIQSLEADKKELQAKLDSAQEATKSKWKQFKIGFADSLNMLNRKVQSALKSE